MQKIYVPIIVFIAVMLVLTFGEGIFTSLAHFIYEVTGIVIMNLSDIYQAVLQYAHANPTKLILGLVITTVICVYIFKNNNDINTPANQRKIAIFLAVFFGWIAAQRFYLGRYGSGIGYLIVAFIFPFIAVLLGFIDAVRFASMDDQTFMMRYGKHKNLPSVK